jgi:hypothetical protein
MPNRTLMNSRTRSEEQLRMEKCCNQSRGSEEQLGMEKRCNQSWSP